MTIEFYGEISEYTKRRADKLKKRYFAVWMMGIAVALFVVTAISAMFQQTFWVILIFAVLIGGVGCFLYMSPMKKAVKEVWKARIVIDGETIFWTQYLPGREVNKQKRVSEIRRVIKTKYCYYLIYNDISNAILCERSLLKRGTFDAFEMLFEGKIRKKNFYD